MRLPGCLSLVLIALFLCLETRAQAPDLLGRKISLNIRNLPQKQALEVVAQEGGFQWSYNANLVDPAKRVSVVAERILLREALYRIMGDGFTYKQNEGYLILKRVKKSENRISGYIVDPKTGERVQNATVYDQKSLRATKTDENGYYELKVAPNAQVVVSKLAYRDTIFQVSSQSAKVTEIDLRLAPAVAPVPNTLRQDWALFSAVQLERYFASALQQVNALNVKKSLHRRFQLSLFPSVGTNQLLSPNVENDISVNLTVGYAKGSSILEVGGIGNIDRGKMAGFQVAGVFNEVGGNTAGLQVAGFLNHTGDTLRGLQVAGALNIAKTANWSGQAAGLVNVAGNGKMLFQAAGFSNVADSLFALQVAAVSNHTFGYFQGLQVAGIINTARRSKAALQVAGLLNVDRHGSAQLQVAGLANIGDTLQGIQATSLLNYAKKVSGIQIGLINRAREIHGLQIGLLNFSRRGGYVVGEVSTNDVATGNIAYKAGTDALYTIVTGGLRPDTSERLWVYGLGLGMRLRLSRWSAFTVDAIHRHVNIGTAHNNFMQEWSQGVLNLELKLGRSMALALGVSANAVFGDETNPAFETNRGKIVPKAPYQTLDFGDARYSGWIGWNLALRAGVFSRRR